MQENSCSGPFLWVPGRVPGLNELFAARLSTSPSHGSKIHNGYSRLKKEYSEKVLLAAEEQCPDMPSQMGDWFTYLVIEPSKRRDPSNICGAAVKLVEDGLQYAGLLSGDGWKNVGGFTFYWTVDKEPGVLVYWSWLECPKRMMLELYERRPNPALEKAAPVKGGALAPRLPRVLRGLGKARGKSRNRPRAT